MLDKIRQFTILTKAMSAFVKLVAMVIVVILLVWQLTGHKTNVVEQNAITSSTFSMVDALNTVPVDVNLEKDVDKFEVYKMPMFALSLPDANLFSDVTAQFVAHALGFTPKAQVMNSGDFAGYKEDVKTLTFDRKLGQVNYSTILSIVNKAIPKSEASHKDVQSAVKKFFENSKLPTTFFDLENLEYQSMVMDSVGVLSPAVLTSGRLTKVVIPYQVSGVRILLPIESYMVVDGNGTIRLMTLFFPNITLTDKMYTLMSWSSAKKIAQSGGAAVISYAANSTKDFSIEKSYAAYYINQREFYSIDKRRILKPIYVFEGDGGVLAVPAEKL